MKKMLSALVAVSALAVALPASAQSYGGWSTGQVERRHIETLDNRIDRARQNRAISVREARALKAQVVQLRVTLRNFLRDGRLNRMEKANIDRGVNRVQMALRQERRDADRRRG